MELEVFIPCSAVLDACVTSKENSADPACCNDMDNPKIISAKSSYEFTFEWTANGALFQILQGMPGADWETEVLLETIGHTPDNNTDLSGSKVAVGPVGVQQSAKVTFTPVLLAPFKGRMMKAVAKLHLRVNGFMVACAFSELGMVHISEDM